MNIVERVRASGVRSAGIPDLVAIGLSRRAEDADAGGPMARKILDRYQRLQALAEASPADLAELTGLESFEVLRAEALIELGRRSAFSSRGEVTTVETKEDVEILLDYLRFEKKEHVVAILLDSKNSVMRTATVHVGTLTTSLVGPREVFREAVREGASSVVVAHNHPSGNPEPSAEDLEVTRRLVEIGMLLDIPVLDHVILGERKSVSLYARGFVPRPPR
jgi:DNA repair protein RadC